MAKPYRIDVYGKSSCDKCHALNQRIDRLLEQPEWSDFEKQSFDVETADGIVAFCDTECCNPRRIPAMLVQRRDEQTGEYRPVPNPRAGDSMDDVCGRSRLYQYLGLQTDYSADGRGVITPKMIAAVLAEARA